MTPFDIYLWQQADSFISILEPFKVFGFIATFLFFVSLIIKAAIVADHPDADVLKVVVYAKKVLLTAICFGVVSVILSAVIPSSKTIALMVAIPAIANSEPIQKDIPELYQMAKEALKEQLTKPNP